MAGVCIVHYILIFAKIGDFKALLLPNPKKRAQKKGPDGLLGAVGTLWRRFPKGEG